MCKLAVSGEWKESSITFLVVFSSQGSILISVASNAINTYAIFERHKKD